MNCKKRCRWSLAYVTLARCCDSSLTKAGLHLHAVYIFADHCINNLENASILICSFSACSFKMMTNWWQHSNLCAKPAVLSLCLSMFFNWNHCNHDLFLVSGAIQQTNPSWHEFWEVPKKLSTDFYMSTWNWNWKLLFQNWIRMVIVIQIYREKRVWKWKLLFQDRHTNLKGKERLQLKTAIPELNPNGDRHTNL